MKQEISYYGRLDEPLLGKNIGKFIVDDTFKELLKRNNDVILNYQHKLMNDLYTQMKNTVDKLEKHANKLIKKTSKKKKKPDEEKGKTTNGK